DQYKRDIPYSTLAQSFGALLRQILSGSGMEIDRWKSDLREAVEPNGRVIAVLVPELEYILGTLPPVPELPPQNAKKTLSTRPSAIPRRVRASGASARPVLGRLAMGGPGHA